MQLSMLDLTLVGEIEGNNNTNPNPYQKYLHHQ
jgi:hypothetical protein